MSTHDGDYYGDAVAALADRRYDTAGNDFARAAWRTLATPRPDQAPFDADEKGWVGTGLQHLVSHPPLKRWACRWTPALPTRRRRTPLRSRSRS